MCVLQGWTRVKQTLVIVSTQYYFIVQKFIHEAKIFRKHFICHALTVSRNVENVILWNNDHSLNFHDNNFLDFIQIDNKS